MIFLNNAWAEYSVYDKDGWLIGVRDDAPEEAKKAYEEYLEAKKDTERFLQELSKKRNKVDRSDSIGRESLIPK